MNVYDFDNTIYRGDSTFDFIKWCIKKKPSLSLKVSRCIPSFLGYSLKLSGKTRFKEKMYSFVQDISDIDVWVEEFWQTHKQNIKRWYLANHKDDDVIISASPEFLLLPICKSLGISHLMASKVDKHTGFYLDINCYGAKKVHRFLEKFSNEIDEFYSDSFSDSPLAEKAKTAYFVDGDILIPWDIAKSRKG